MRALATVLVSVLFLPTLAAQPTDSTVVGPVEASWWIGAAGSEGPASNVTPGAEMALHVTGRALGNGTYRVAVDDIRIASGVLVAALAIDPPPTTAAFSNATGPATVAVAFAAPSLPGTASVTVTLVVLENATALQNATEVARKEVASTFLVVAPAPPPAPGVPVWVWAIGTVVVLGAGAAVLRFRKRQVKVAPRSRTLQELEVETKAEKARPKDAATIAAEYEAVQKKEAERLATREASILDAKRADIRKSIDLARQRHERGELSAFQFQKLKENKEKQLAELERQGGNGGAD
ncbi:MAG TPA: hypothetical protein VI997_05110 [Candidatus Thermoplasmatota archaeon]|nr:hypothetical protein [Candidatus Thermoplasmatota archaeon]